jgi:hypothetical protein
MFELPVDECEVSCEQFPALLVGRVDFADARPLSKWVRIESTCVSVWLAGR